MPARRFLLVACVSLAACAHPAIGVPGGPAPAGAAEDKCLLSSGPVASHAPTVTIGLTEAVDPRHAPLARNDAERIVFRHLYDAPVRVDCEGHVLPELAGEWNKDDGGRRWTFRLRDGAQFWDGAPVTAQDVVFGKSGAGYTLGVVDNRTITLSLAKGQDDVPALLGDRGLTVTKPAPDSSWPIGAGRYWATSGTTTAQEIRAHSTSGDTIVFRLATGGGSDARDLLDGGVDLLVTRDRALRDYGATLQNHAVVALPWDRTYVYVTAEAGSTHFDGLEQSVRAEARRAEGGSWWLDLRACGQGGASPPTSTGQHRIVYLRTDPTARELAGRLAALTHAVATGRAADDFSDALASGREWGYIVALPRVTLDPCRTAKNLLPPWAATFTALVDTRAAAIVRRGTARWTVDQDGTVHLAP